MQDNAQLLSVARAIADRQPVDWDEAESSLAAADIRVRDALRELRVIAQIARLHRASGTVVEAGRWAHLTLLEHIGYGSYGDVYRALDTRLDREVALKLLRRADTEVDALGSVAIEEARLLARVRHPNVVTVHGADRIEGRVGLWMEFLRGRTLAEIVRDRGSLPGDEVAAIACDVCRALGAVHTAGLLHRDVKAQNVMREEDGRVVLMDFGAGRETTDTDAEITGTPLYLAPEVVAGQPASVRSDIYSLGVLLFHLLTGSYPVQGRSLAEIRVKLAAGDVASLSALRPRVPAPLAAVIKRALAPLPEARFASASEMLAVLQPRVDAHLARRAPLRTAGVVTAIVLAAGLAGLGWYRRTAQPMATGDRVVWKGVGVDMFGSISDDGRYLTYVDWNTTDNLMLRDLVSGVSTPLTRNSVVSEFGTAQYSVLSRNGRRVAYAWLPRGGAGDELRLIEIAGGRTVSDRVAWTPNATERVRPLAWSSDQRSLLIMIVRPTRGEHALAMLEVGTDRVRHIKTLPAFLRTDDAALSPDAQFVAYDLAQPGGPQDVFIRAVDGTAESRVTSGTGRNVVMGWSESGQLLFASDRTGKLALWAVSVVDGRASGAPTLVKDDIGSTWSLGLTSSNALFVAKNSGAPSIRVAPFDAVQGTIDESAPGFSQHFIESRGRHDWSADGRYLAFIDCGRLGGGPCAISVRTTATGEVRTVNHRMGYVWYPRLSPDGRFIAAAGNLPREGPGIYLIEVTTGKTSLMVTGAARQQFSLDWSADGTRIHYLRDSDDLVRLVERELASGIERELFRTTVPGVREIRLSPDRRMVAFRARETERSDSTVRVAPLAGGSASTLMVVPHPDILDSRIEWTADGRALLIQKGPTPNVAQELWLAPVTGSPRRLNIDTRTWDGDGFVQLHPDGRRLSYVSFSGTPGGEIWALENFLPRRAGRLD
jgi:serine/threonine-protein kinase